MFGICFYHTDFDRDVSSGTSHSIQQWSELLNAFNIKDVAVINQTKDKIPYHNYKSLEEFKVLNCDKNIAYTRALGDKNYRDVNYLEFDWIVFGSSEKWDMDCGIAIDTYENKELYPREAAAIILAEASWRIR